MKKFFSLLVVALFAINSTANEGMWMLQTLKKLNEAQMQKLGFKLTAEDIYSINQSSIKDAIVRLNGGMCTSEIISDQALVLTNHHCAYGAIQTLSSEENNYLRDGFWAMAQSEELPIPDMYVSFLQRIEDVTERVLENVNDDMSEEDRSAAMAAAFKEIEAEASEGGKYETQVKTFFEGNEFYLMVYENYEDVRLVGAPDESIGKFGGDTDNWMWPRHTGDFSLLRIYTAPDGSPAPYSADNVPMKPKHHLPVATDGVKEGDFTMIMGFPGSTDRYLSSYGVQQALDIEQPARVELRGEKLRLMKEEMDKSDKVDLQYASKYASISNYWKYFIGQQAGLKKLKVYDKKKAIENDFSNWVNADASRQKKYGETLTLLEEGYKELSQFKLPETYFTEAAVGSEAMLFAFRANRMMGAAIEEPSGEKWEATKAGVMAFAADHWKDYDIKTDKKVTARMMEMYNNDISSEFHPEAFAKAKGDWKKWVDKNYAKSIFTSEAKFNAFMKAPSKKVLDKDPLASMFTEFLGIYRGKIGGGAGAAYSKIDKGYRLLVAGLREMNPEKMYYPNANSTMRLTYGQVKEYIPADGKLFQNVTTTDGIVQKEDPNDPEFIVPSKLIDLIEKKDFGRWADENGEMIVCFISNNDITGGNSGSPVINGYGEIIGLAFDGNWEAMSGDIAFEPELQRTISVDIRYVMFVIDKYAGAKNLIEEMTFASRKDTKQAKMIEKKPEMMPELQN
ncbi:MAG: S46 family peptidase [Bacteroidota bacterium]